MSFLDNIYGENIYLFEKSMIIWASFNFFLQ